MNVLGKGLLLLALSIMLSWPTHAISREYDLGIDLKPCDTRVCYSSKAQNPERYTPPLRLDWDDLKRVVRSISRVAIVRESDRYMEVQFASDAIGVVHNIEFYRERSSGLIHLRTSSNSALSWFREDEHKKKIQQVYRAANELPQKKNEINGVATATEQ